MLTRLQLAKRRQRIRELKGRRNTLERVAMKHHLMVAASLLERHFRPGGPAAYYLSVPSPRTSRHRYVRKAGVERIRRETSAWRQFSQTVAEWVRVNKAIERLLREIGKGRCRDIEELGRKSG